jgi:5'-nucleotidase
VSYKEIKNETNPATWAAKVSVKVVEQVIKTSPKGAPLLPLGYGLTVNIPAMTPNNTNPDIFQTRMTGNANVNEAVWDEKRGTFTWANIRPYAAGVNTCVNGDCSLPGETYIVENGGVSMSIYVVDYTSPMSCYTDSIIKRLKPLTEAD